MFKLSNRRQGLHWESVSGVHLVVLVSADFQGIQRSSLGADPPSDLDMDWIRVGCSDHLTWIQSVRKKQTNISVDAILLRCNKYIGCFRS